MPPRLSLPPLWRSRKRGRNEQGETNRSVEGRLHRSRYLGARLADPKRGPANLGHAVSGGSVWVPAGLSRSREVSAVRFTPQAIDGGRAEGLHPRSYAGIYALALASHRELAVSRHQYQHVLGVPVSGRQVWGLLRRSHLPGVGG